MKIKGLGLKQIGNFIGFQEGDEFICNLTELMRTDINRDGFEDVLLNKWFWTGGTMTISEMWWITSIEPGKLEILEIN